MAEYQNDPKPPAIAGEVVLSAEEIRRKVNGRQPGEVPKACEHVTAFIDVHDDLLFCAVCGWEQDLTGYGIEYGSFPEQSKRYYTLATRAADATAAIQRRRKGKRHLRRARILRSRLAVAQLHPRRRQQRCRSAAC